MKRITAGDRLRYRIDNLFSRGPIVLIGVLFLLSAVLITVVVAFMSITRQIPVDSNSHQLTIGGMAWTGLLTTLDTGEIENVANNSSVALAALLVSTLGGIFVTSTLIGLLTTGISNRLDALRKGRSLVVEDGHTVILGWSPQIFTLLSELVLANENQRHAAVAILADRDKVEMEDEIRLRLGDTKGTRIICRTGNPIDLSDLELVNPHRSRAVIIPAPEIVDPDSYIIKAILALTNNPHRRPEPYHIVAEIQYSRNLEIARLVGRAEALVIDSGEMIARIIAQTCRQSGLSVVYTELLDFGGDEIYFQEESALIGTPFGAALLLYEDSSLIGLRFADGRTAVNPPMDTVIARGDAVIAISRDDDTVRISGFDTPPIMDDALRSATPAQTQAEHTLLLGWNRSAATIIRELDNYVAAGSRITVVSANEVIDAESVAVLAGLVNQEVRQIDGDTTDRRLLDSLEVTSYDHIITLTSTDSLDVQAADARTLITLLHLRDIVERSGKDLSIVSEMRDLRNRELAQVTQADDFIVSNQIVSLLLTQIAENRDLLPVFQDLFDADGSELYLKPVEQYIDLARPVTFYTIVESARRRGEIAIGYRQQAHSRSAAEQYGVRVNPRKSEPIGFVPGDRIIVVAEN